MVLARRPVTIDVTLLGAQYELPIARRRQPQRAAINVGLIGAEGRAVETVGEPTFIVTMINRKAPRQQSRRDRAAERRFSDNIGPSFHRNPRTRVKRIARPTRAYQNGATRYVASVERPLRTAQHFHRFDIKEISDRARIDAVIDTVHKQADRRINRSDRRIHANATDREVRNPARGGDVFQLHVRHRIRQRLQILDATRAQLFGAERIQRHRQILRCALAALRRCHNNFFFGLRERRRGRENSRDEGATDQHRENHERR